MRAAAIGLILSSVAAAAPVHGEARREALLFANCPREAGEYFGSFRGRILLNEEFLDGRDLRESIEHQLRYLWGHYRNDAAAHGAMQLSLSAEPPEIQILSQKKVPYGRELALPYDTKEERLKLDDPYTLKAAARGRVHAGDPAISVEYQIRFKLALCGRGQDPPATVRVPLPPDPWLAYWYVPKKYHRPLRYHNERATTNPCADDDFADLPHPFYYWYDWLPTRHGPDDAGRSFDCRKYMRVGTDYDYYDVSFERISAASRDFSLLRRQLSATSGELTATIVFGVVDHSFTELGLERWRDALGSGGSFGERAAATRALWTASRPKEFGTGSFLTALTELGGVMSVERHSTTVDDGYLMVEVHGRLKLSGRPLRARFWLGMTDIFGPKPPLHWRILERGLAEDQLVIYYGHSGIGENFRLAQIEKHLGLSHQAISDELRRSPLRLVAFLSCYSIMYFGQDLLDAGAQRDNGAYFIFTGMEHSTHEAGPLGVLDLIDRVLAPDNPSGRIDRLPLLSDDEFWLIKEVAGTRDTLRYPNTPKPQAH